MAKLEIQSETKQNCQNCLNKGVVYSLREETFCDSCIYQKSRRVDWYAPKPQAVVQIPYSEAELLLIYYDIQFHCPTTGCFVIEGLADSLQLIIFFPNSCKLEVSKRGTETKYLEYATIEDCVKHIANLI